MQLHQLRPKHKNKAKKRVGRGGKHGTYSGKGIKGQKSRAGRKLEPIIRGWLKRYPKLRGYKFKGRERNIAIINIDALEKKFESGNEITPQILVAKKIIKKIKGKTPQVKILSQGKLTKKLIIKNCQISKSAKEKIKKFSGEVLE
jgi:large subunit ribosomal protein L15